MTERRLDVEHGERVRYHTGAELIAVPLEVVPRLQRRTTVSTLTRLSAAQLQLAEVLATECARCSHPLSQHPVSARAEGSRCTHYDVIPNVKGYRYGNAKFVYCKCVEFADFEPSEKLFT
jgi:hypothetical protein